MNIKKCTNVSGRALHLCKKARCSKLAFIDTSKSFSLTFYCFYSVTHHFSTFHFVIAQFVIGQFNKPITFKDLV